MKSETSRGKPDILFYLIKDDGRWNIYNAATNGLILPNILPEKALAFLKTNNPGHPAVSLIEEEIKNSKDLAPSNPSREEIGNNNPRNFNHYLVGKFNA